jgi:predicted O-methyltransferase YrrM
MTTAAHEIGRAFGYLRPVEIDLLIKTCKGIDNKPPVLVNIGSGAGTSGAAMRVARPGAYIYTIDKSPGGPLGGLENERNTFASYKVGPPTHQILGDSKAVGEDWGGGLVDLVFIDGDHSYEGASGDIEVWLPHIKEGGLMVFHDYNEKTWPTVVQAVDDHMGKYELVERADTLVVYRIAKPKTRRKRGNL